MVKIILKQAFGLIILLCCMVGCQSEQDLVPTIQNTPAASLTDNNTNSSATEITTIYFACLEQDVARFSALAEGFHEDNPSINVEIIALEELLLDDFSTNVDERVLSRVDSAYYWVTYPGVRNGYVKNLTPFIDQDPNFAADDFFPNLLAAYTYQGEVFALPSEVRVWLLAYDKEKFDAVNLPYPDINWSQNDFVSLAQSLTVDKGNGEIQYGFIDTMSIAKSAFIGALAEPVFDNELLLAPTTIAEVQWYVDLAQQKEIMPVITNSPESLAQGFEISANGQVAMWPDQVHPEDSDEQIGFTLLPTQDGPRAVAGMYGLVMSAGTQHAQESWQWLSYLTRQTVTEYGHLPARRSVAQQTGYWDQFSPEIEALLRVASENFIVRSSMNPLARPIHAAISQALTDGTAVAESLAEAQISLQETLAPVTRDETFTVTYPKNEDRATIRFSVSPEADSVVWQVLADEFETNQDDIKVELLQPNEVGDADCFSDIRIINTVEAAANLLPLDPLIMEDTTFETAAFTSMSIDSLTIEGQLFGIPLQAI